MRYIAMLGLLLSACKVGEPTEVIEVTYKVSVTGGSSYDFQTIDSGGDTLKLFDRKGEHIFPTLRRKGDFLWAKAKNRGPTGCIRLQVDIDGNRDALMAACKPYGVVEYRNQL